MLSWADARFTGATIDETAQLNSREIGRVTGYREVLSLTHTEVNQEFGYVDETEA